MSGVECFLCLGEQEDMSSLGGHLTSHHKISHEADVILLLQQCSQKERRRMTRELIKTDPDQNTPPASPNDKTEVEDLVEEEATEEEPKDEAPTVEDHVAEATEEPKERPVLRNWIREVPAPAQEIKTSKRKSLNFLLSTNAVKKRYVAKNKNSTSTCINIFFL